MPSRTPIGWSVKRTTNHLETANLVSQRPTHLVDGEHASCFFFLIVTAPAFCWTCVILPLLSSASRARVSVDGPAFQGRRSPGLLLVRAWSSFVATSTFLKHNGSPCTMIATLLSCSCRHRHTARRTVYIRLSSVLPIVHLRIRIFTPCVFRQSSQGFCLASRPQLFGLGPFNLANWMQR